MSFKTAGYSGVAITWTIGFAAAFAYFLVRVVLAFAGSIRLDLFDLGVALLLGVIMLYAYVRSVKGYTVEGSNVVVQRAGPGRITIPVDKIRSIEHDPTYGNFFNRSLLGIGGLFGWAGKTRVRNPSDINATDAEVYGTNPSKSVIMELESGLVLIVTPDDPQGFVARVSEAMPRRSVRNISKSRRK